MYGSLLWIEWFDRLDRVLNSIRMDLASWSRAVSPRGLAAMERSTRQLSALTHDLQLLDRKVLASAAASGETDQAGGLKQALEATLHHLENLAQIQDGGDAAANERTVAAIDSALRDSRYETAMLLEPRRRRA